ncbi:hypothetical protein PF010_g14581 [Phytophthora fragariae]|uniref:Uncharacterized protein n=1 Tax=Phytophthora fragariae TaxID=53985 RepID=A0A6A3EB82_9STRA|nr:hypothetical protein PF009_g21468 [Phytophthora fragariae]KAE9101031.1 hypothetical protein PF010_g14581 [Phytophthora fragariae]KAE9202185.1 hypothetical protein PF002_g21323 [Phytophthora fragariae]
MPSLIRRRRPRNGTKGRKRRGSDRWEGGRGCNYCRRGGGRCRNSNDRDAVDAAQVSPASEPERRLLRPDDDNYDAGDEEAGGAAKALEKAKNNTNGAVVSFTRALSRMRPDRGDAGIFDELHVEAYGHLVPLVQWLWWHARAEQVTV